MHNLIDLIFGGLYSIDQNKRNSKEELALCGVLQLFASIHYTSHMGSQSKQSDQVYDIHFRTNDFLGYPVEQFHLPIQFFGRPSGGGTPIIVFSPNVL